MPIPRIAVVEKRIPAIKDFLVARGAEVLVPTNQYELLRFRSSHGVSVLYRTERGKLTHTGQSQDALLAFFEGRSWASGNSAKRRKQHGPDIQTLLARDGDDCFYCLEPLRDDITREHLLSVAHGGPDHIANKALAHQRCNAQAHHLSLMEKIALREGCLFRKYGWIPSDNRALAPALASLAPALTGAST